MRNMGKTRDVTAARTGSLPKFAAALASRELKYTYVML
jgi:hypothetical protein